MKYDTRDGATPIVECHSRGSLCPRPEFRPEGAQISFDIMPNFRPNFDIICGIISCVTTFYLCLKVRNFCKRGDLPKKGGARSVVDLCGRHDASICSAHLSKPIGGPTSPRSDAIAADLSLPSIVCRHLLTLFWRFQRSEVRAETRKYEKIISHQFSSKSRPNFWKICG